MSYQVLARKWRPANFDEIVGQEHVLRAMINALDTERLHHAYLFTGTRGVGKTTLARILAKCLNCESGVSSKPCGECHACTEIAEGRFVDLIEVDAASRTKVDDTRELLDNVQYAPTGGRFKVYLIDEVHMLSKHSFNALLKTLEEPPPHVKFLLATTDPQKLPVTVLSRCLQFNLKRVPEDLITAHLEKLLKAESVEYDLAALQHLAHAAEGSLRDALSLLDQGIAFGNGEVRDADIGQMLGSISRTHLTALISAVASGDANLVMSKVAELAELAPDYDAVLAAMATLLHDLALSQHVPDSLEMRGLDVHELSAIAAAMSPQDIQLYYEIALRARRDLSLVPNARHGLEMALLRMLAFRPDSGGANQLTSAAKPQSALSHAPKNQSVHAAAKQPPVSASQPAPATQPPATPQTTPQSTPPPTVTEQPQSNPTGDQSPWEKLLPKLGLGGMAKAFANHCTMTAQSEGQVTLTVAKRHESLLTDSVRQKVEAALSEQMAQATQLNVDFTEENIASPAEKQRQAEERRQLEAEASIRSDPVVETLQNQFGADIIPGSISPNNQ